MPDLVVRGLSAGYGAITVLRDITLTIGTGQRIALVGSNGAGKTTLVKAINGLVRLGSGTVEWDGADVTSLGAPSRTRSGIATVAEGRQLFPDCTVEENLLAASTFGEPKKRRRQSVDEVFALFPRLRERARQRAGTMSGGEQQMLAIGRALMVLPRLLILDEPSVGLAPRVVGEIFDVLAQLADRGVTLLLVEQNVRLSLETVEYAYVLQQGRIVLSGASADLIDDDSVRRAYLGG